MQKGSKKVLMQNNSYNFGYSDISPTPISPTDISPTDISPTFPLLRLYHFSDYSICPTAVSPTFIFPDYTYNINKIIK